jgi:hypothetical protein
MGFLILNYFSHHWRHYVFRPIWPSSGASKIAVGNCCIQHYSRYRNAWARKREYILDFYSLTVVQQFPKHLMMIWGHAVA